MESPSVGELAMGVFGTGSGPEQVMFCQDRPTGLRAVVAIHSTALGPGLGGTRCYPYRTEDDAVRDVLDLSRAMTYKNAMAGIDFGGAKAVIWGDPRTVKTEPLLRAYGRFVESIGGRYFTACDVGTYVRDMDVIARETRFVTGRSEVNGGAGDSSVLTALGVFHGMRAAAEHLWGQPTLAGRTVGIAGLGKVGRRLAGHLLADGATVLGTDVSEAALAWARTERPEITLVADTATLVREDLDVYSPCAMGSALDDGTAAVLRAAFVAGGANNQLAAPGVEKLLAERGVLYVPDYVVNAGGVIQVADEVGGFNLERATHRAAGIFETTRQILRVAQAEGVLAAVAADHLAERRIAEVGRLRSIYLRP